MNNVTIEQPRPTVEQERRAIEEAGGGSVVESIGGIGALVLSILGLIGFIPIMMASIASIAAGGALLIGGGTMASQYSRIFGGARQSLTRNIIGGGMAMESLGGVAAIVLGILALLGIHSLTVLGASAIVLGCALLLASGAMAKLTALPIREPVATEQARYPDQAQHIMRDTLYAASGSEALIGAGAIVLGILALSGFAPLTLILVAFLAVGASILLAGTAVSGRMFESVAH